MANSSFIGLLTVFLLPVTNGFGVQPTFLQQVTTKSSDRSTTKTSLSASLANSKYFQLEEMEDQECCTTEVYLADDGSVRVSTTQTDGPPPSSASGTWEEREGSSSGDTEGEESSPFRMMIARTFGTGVGIGADSGSFTVERTFRGSLAKVGDAVSITGSMHILDDIRGEIDVGFFSMIDTTDARDYEKEEK